MAFIDYYKIMGINKDTPQKDIRPAYTRRAKQFHPDLHPDDPKAKAKFQALNEAYDVLGNPEKRKKYDQYGENWKNAEAFDQQGQQWGQGGGFGESGGADFDGFDFSQFSGGSGGFSDFFEELFGHGGRRRSAMHENADMHASVDIDMYTALLGGEIILQTQTSKLRMKVKPLTQNGSKVRLKGKGYQRSDGTFGDMIITYNVTLPTYLSEHQKGLLREMRNG